MQVLVSNAQRTHHINTAQMIRLTRSAIRHLRIRTSGTLSVAFIDTRRMRALNRRFCHHDRITDVLSFRYDDDPHGLPRSWQQGHIVGDILIAPSAAQAYAKTHRISYQEELARYVVHGLLHWFGYDDHTPSQQRMMHRMEDRVLTNWRGRERGRETMGRGKTVSRTPHRVPYTS